MEKKPDDWVMSYATVALIFGIVLIALGAGLIYSAYQQHQWMATGYEGPYWDWDTNYLLVGIALSLVGTAVASTSETYRLLTNRKKGV